VLPEAAAVLLLVLTGVTGTGAGVGADVEATAGVSCCCCAAALVLTSGALLDRSSTLLQDGWDGALALQGLAWHLYKVACMLSHTSYNSSDR
jgi:hypothetical protein